MVYIGTHYKDPYPGNLIFNANFGSRTETETEKIIAGVRFHGQSGDDGVSILVSATVVVEVS